MAITDCVGQCPYGEEIHNIQRLSEETNKLAQDHDRKMRGNGTPGYDERLRNVERFIEQISKLRWIVLTSLLSPAGAALVGFFLGRKS